MPEKIVYIVPHIQEESRWKMHAKHLPRIHEKKGIEIWGSENGKKLKEMKLPHFVFDIPKEISDYEQALKKELPKLRYDVPRGRSPFEIFFGKKTMIASSADVQDKKIKHIANSILKELKEKKKVGAIINFTEVPLVEEALKKRGVGVEKIFYNTK